MTETREMNEMERDRKNKIRIEKKGMKKNVRKNYFFILLLFPYTDPKE